MRTTLTIEDDVAAVLERMRRDERASPKELVNRALRCGLEQMTSPPLPAQRFRTQTVDSGRCLVGSLDDIEEVLAIAEGEGRR